MLPKKFLLPCAGGLFLLVSASYAYAADVPSDTTIMPLAVCPPFHTETKGNVIYYDPTCPARNPQTVSSPEKVYLIRENPFFILHIEKALQHARDAEIAGNMGQSVELRSVELMDHAEISLMQAREAQRAGNVPGLNEGIANLRKALVPPISLRYGSASRSGVDPQCIDALERQCEEVQPGSGRLQKCVEDKIKCQEKWKAAIAAAAIAENRHQKEVSEAPRLEAAVRSATDFVREARKNLSQAGGVKFVEIRPQGAVTTR